MSWFKIRPEPSSVTITDPVELVEFARKHCVHDVDKNKTYNLYELVGAIIEARFADAGMTIAKRR